MSGPEDTYAEQPSLDWLRMAGWAVLNGSEISPGGATPERATWDAVVLVDRLKGAIADLNPELPADAIDRVAAEVLRSESPEPIRDHAAFHDLLGNGVPVSYERTGEGEISTRAKVVDLTHPDQNDFLAVNQFTIISGPKNRRPDILGFINGLPLFQLELKDPAGQQATTQSAVNQVQHYLTTIPQLYRYVEVVAVSDVVKALMGTITTPAEHFSEWKSMNPTDDAGKSALEVLISGALAPARLLELIRDFVLFETDGAKLWKVLAKYHQVDAVNRAVESTHQAMQGDGRGGVVWHTQGAGKSYSMVFYMGKVRRDERFANPTLVTVVDQTELDTQLFDTIARQTSLSQSVVQADKIEDGPESLRSLLNVPGGGIISTTIQKFATTGSEKVMPVLSTRSNIIVLADEAQRSQYDIFARNITRALPNAVRIGFTGTPIERGDRSTSATFGDYISVYRMSRAVEDGATVPIYYESRSNSVGVAREDLMQAAEDELESETPEVATKFISRWTNVEKLVGAPTRMDELVADLVQHFRDRCKVLEGKGMLVAMSRRLAVEYTNRLKVEFGADAVTCVISASAGDDPAISAYRRSKEELREVAKDFRDETHPLRFVVVANMWLVGFDVPCLHTMYIDKPMKDHGLLQAIARVNRVFKDKPGGLVVDYIGIGDDLRASLAAYHERDVDDAAIPIEKAVVKLLEKHQVLLDFLHPISVAGWTTMTPAQRTTLIIQAYALFAGDEEKEQAFLDDHLAFAKLFALVSTDSRVVHLEPDAEFLGRLAGTVRKYHPVSGQVSPSTEQAVKQFYSEGLGAGEIIDVFGLAGEERPEISILSDDFLDDLTKKIKEPGIQLAFLKKLLQDEVHARAAQNPIQARHFGQELEKALRRFASRQISSAEIVKYLVELAKRMRAARTRHQQLGLTPEELAFYDALVGQASGDTPDPQLVAIVRELVTSIRQDLTVDWTSHESTEAAMRARIKRLLRKKRSDLPEAIFGGGGGVDHATQLVLEQARTLYRYWPETDKLIDVA